MARSKTRPPAPNERPLALTMTGASSLPVAAPHRERLPASPSFAGPRQTKAVATGRADMVAFWVFVTLVLLGLLAAARAFMVM